MSAEFEGTMQVGPK